MTESYVQNFVNRIANSNMDIRLFSFTSLLIGFFYTSSWASYHNGFSRRYVKIGQDSIPSDCLPRNNLFNSSSNPTLLTIHPNNSFWMSVDLLLRADSNGDESINEGRYDNTFYFRGIGEEQYKIFRINITANTDNANWWRIDVSTESKNIDIRTTEQPGNGWISGHSFHSMTIQIARNSGSWYDIGCWEQKRYATTESSSTLSTTTLYTTKSTEKVPASTEIMKMRPEIKESTATESSTKQSGSTSTATESSTKQSGSTSTPMQEVEGRVQENKIFDFVKFFFFFLRN